jgi:alkanesulfonate monooxygenase SsuD/methylene tetrahydromethanopterin reductase-like flavin-dependent oxidoreductase (luciferase family)
LKLGIVLPQGMLHEFAGWSGSRAAARAIAVARRAEDAGIESVWVYDHLGTFGTLRDEPTLEAFALLGGVAGATSRVGLGPLVARVGLRNAGLLVKHVATLDAVAGGRVELGLGAANPEGEARSFGFDRPEFADRAGALRETAELARRLFAEGRASAAGAHVQADDAILNPRGAEGHRVPIVIGGNSRPVWRIAVESADEVNLDGRSPDGTRTAIADLATLCRDAGRDPATLTVSVHLYPRDVKEGGASRARLFADYAATGISRVMTLVPGVEDSDDKLDALVADARAAGVQLA